MNSLQSLPSPKNQTKIKIVIKSFETHLITNCIQKITQFFICLTTVGGRQLSNESIKTVELPKHIKRYTLLRSPHVNKKSREQFQRITFKKLLILSLSSVKANFFIKHLRHFEFYGVQLQLTIVS